MATCILNRASQALVLGGALLSCASLWSGGAPPLDQEPLAEGQMLARFAAGSELDEDIARLLASGETGSDTLHAFVESAGAMFDVPLFVRQVTSGREVVLEIERNRVLDAAAGRLRESPEVRNVKIDRAAGPQHYWRDRLLIELTPDGDLAAFVTATDEQHAAQGIQRRLTALLKNAHYVVATRMISSRQVELRVDLRATTLNLVKALQALSNVEYAQPNFMATIN